MYSEPYPYITKGMVCLLGDAAHPVCNSHETSQVRGIECNRRLDDASPESSSLYGNRRRWCIGHSVRQEIFQRRCGGVTENIRGSSTAEGN